MCECTYMCVSECVYVCMCVCVQEMEEFTFFLSCGSDNRARLRTYSDQTNVGNPLPPSLFPLPQFISLSSS